MTQDQTRLDAKRSLRRPRRRQKWLALEMQLLQKITLAVSESPDFQAALAIALKQVCEATGWEYGEAWLPTANKTSLACSSGWYGSTPKLETFRKLSEQLSFLPDLGLPGRVWASKQPEWLKDVSQEPESSFLRNHIAAEADLKAGLAVPVVASGEVVAVLVFLMFEARPEDKRLVNLVATVTAQLGPIVRLKQTEAALGESQRRLTNLIDSLPGIVFSCTKDPEWSRVYMSEGCLSLTGYSSAEFLGKQGVDRYHKITHPDDLPHVLSTIEQAIANHQPYVVEYRIRTQSGQEKWLWEKGNGVFSCSGQLLVVEGFITDITELKQAEKALREKEEFLQLVLDNIPQSIFWKDTHSTYLGCNKRWAQMIGLSHPQAIVGKTDDDLPGCPNDVYTYQHQDWQVVSTGVPQQRIVETKQCVNGRQVSLDVSKLPIHDTDGNVIGLLGAIEDITERLRAEEALRHAEAKYRSIFENAVEGIFQTTTDGRYLTANPMLATIYGYDSPDDLLRSLTDIRHQLYVDPARRDEFMRLIQQAGAVWGFESQVYKRDGSIIWISESARTIRDTKGRVIGYEGTVEDITQRKQAEAELRKRESLLQGVAEATNHLLTNPNYKSAIAQVLATLGAAAEVDRVYIYENHPHPETGEIAMSLRFEWTQQQVLPTIDQPYWQNQPYSALGMERWYDVLSNGYSISGPIRDFPALEQAILRRDQIRSILAVPIHIDEQFWGYIGFDDCTRERQWSKSEESILVAMAASIGAALKRQQAEEIVRYQAFHDLLTGLPNRVLFDSWLLSSLVEARHSNQMLAVLFLDLDRFKTINDTLGHAIGDQLLQGVATRLSCCLREGDTVARWGGDEFTLLLPAINSAADALKVAQRILEALRPAFYLEGHELHITSSIGIALYPQDGDDGPTLLRNADAALYQAKEYGRNNLQLYTASLTSQASDLLTLQNQLHHALEREEFVVYYQPQVNIYTGSITCMEALVRWQHPELGLVPPEVFIPLAEENGLILSIGEWILRTACAQNKLWQRMGLPALRVSVNLSAQQFQQPSLARAIAQTLQETKLEPQFLALEITETTMMQDVGFARRVLVDLHDQGIAISIDDFGTGYSSLGYLKKFPLQMLKIDQSFIQDLATDSQDAAIVAAVLALGKGLNLEVIAEGVETEAQLDKLRSLQCQEMQGYFFSSPLSAVAATEFLYQHQAQATLYHGGANPQLMAINQLSA